MHRHTTKLTRECMGIQIPSGEPITLKEGMEVTITQALGGSFTVITDQGYMVRIAGLDADAIGEKSVESAVTHSAQITFESVKENIWNQLQTCYDPEIPVSIVELGLIYDCDIKEAAPKEYEVHVKMTLTAPGCGMGQILMNDIETKLTGLPGVKKATVEIVLDPPWDREMMSESAKLQLGLF